MAVRNNLNEVFRMSLQCKFFVVFLLNILAIRCQNASRDMAEAIVMPFEKHSEELSNQKKYVERLNEKVLAHERERLERTFQQNSFSYFSSVRHPLGEDEHFLTPGKSIGSDLRRMSNEQLCVTKMQAIYDTLPSVEAIQDPQEILSDITYKLSVKLKEYITVVEKNKQHIENVLSSQKVKFYHTDIACCQLAEDTLRYDEHFGVDVTLEKGCMSFPYSHSPARLYIGKNFTSTFSAHYMKFPTLMWQYFISSEGAHSEYPGYHKHCDQKTDRHRQIYVDTIRSKTKHVIIVVDQGNSLSMAQIASAKNVGKHILGLLSTHDKVTIFGLASDAEFAQGSNCTHHNFLYATNENKLELAQFFDNLTRKSNATDHVRGFQTIYKIIEEIENQNQSLNHEILVAYISRGLLSSIADRKHVLEIISDGNKKSKAHIVINTYALIDHHRPIMYEKVFLQDVASQNFTKYSIYHKSSKIQGVMIVINSTKNNLEDIGDIFKDFPPHISSKIVFSLPYFDPVSKGVVVSISQQVFLHNHLAGVTGIDVSLTDLTEHISYFANSETLYVFLVDESGIAVTHPSFSHPAYAGYHPIHTHMRHLEDKPGFQAHYHRILRDPSGEIIIPLNDTDESRKNKGKYVVYRWEKVEGTPYIVCLVSIEPAKSQKVLKDFIYTGTTYFIYHHMDLLPLMYSCRHMKQLSSLKTTGVFLSPSCFVSPYKFLTEDETPKTAFAFSAYLKDSKNIIPNPGLKPGIRNEVLALAQIFPAWKSAAENEDLSPYIVRRFVATKSGVFLAYPATLTDESYDPTHRDWFVRALEHPGKIILTSPYLDVGGAGYIVTLSHTVYEGQPSALHSSEDNVVAVMGIDFTFGYFYKVLLDKMTICKHDHMICFLLDDKGYLISHPYLMDPSDRGPVEQQHITHKEPLVANDLLNHRLFITKKICSSYGDRTIQRFYQLNTSLDSVLTNLVHGEQCSKYQVMHIYGSNVFLGVVNQTCDGITAFCPCSMTDRLCLNCLRMEPTECECPCECHLKTDICLGQLANESSRYSTCPHFPELPNLPIVNLNIFEMLPECFDHHCHTRNNINDCFGVLGCEWCQLEADAATPLPHAFCTQQRKCFGGVLGSRTPYADEIIEKLPEGEFLVIKSTPVGPVAGGIIAVFIMLAVLVYSVRMHRGGTAPNSPHFRMTQLSNEDPEPFLAPDPSPPGPNLCQMVPRIENVISPYRVPTNYRRPTGGDSDHGYSTMTPHEDTETAPYFEPLLLRRHSENVTSQQSISGSSRTSSPTSYVPSTTCSSSPSMLKMECGIPAWVPPKKDFRMPSDGKMKGTHVLAQVQVHTEGN